MIEPRSDHPPIRTAYDEARDEVRRIAAEHKVAYRDIMGSVRTHAVVRARRDVYRSLVEGFGWSSVKTGLFLGKDHSSVLFGLGRLKKKPRL